MNTQIPRLWFGLPILKLTNITSVSHKNDELVTKVSSVKDGIIAITEAWQIVR